jgi:hypothetical protein
MNMEREVDWDNPLKEETLTNEEYAEWVNEIMIEMQESGIVFKNFGGIYLNPLVEITEEIAREWFFEWLLNAPSNGMMASFNIDAYTLYSVGIIR